MKVEILKQYSVFMSNKPGSLSRMAKFFADSGVNILGIASEVRDDSGMVRIAVDSKDAATVLSKSGFANVETRIISVEVPDRAGELARITEALAQGNVNITTVYATAIGGHSARILINTDHIDKAFKLLERMAKHGEAAAAA